MLFKLSLKNIRKSIKDYSIYFFTLVFAVAMFYSFNSLDAQSSMMVLSESKYEIVKSIILIMGYVSVFVSIILGFLIVYSNNFLIKRRKKEIGLYFTLGMSKRKVSTILVIETLIIGIISLIVGLLVGVGLSQFISILTAKLFEVDMTNLKFIFSSLAFTKTIIYFGIIFILVMLFNILTLSRYKLIDLLNAGKKNESIKVRNKYVTIITFISSIGLIGYAYYLLFDNVLLFMDYRTIIMLISGALGTYLLFFSVSGFLLKVVEHIKKLYYKDLNLFTLKQVNSKINTTVLSTTIICLMLLLTIGILSSSLSLAKAFNNDLVNNNLSNFTIIAYGNSTIVKDDLSTEVIESTSARDLEEYMNNGSLDKYTKDYAIIHYHHDKNLRTKDMITKASFDKLKKEYGSTLSLDFKVSIISETEYKKLMEVEKQEIIDIEDNEYLLLANIDLCTDAFKEYYEKKIGISINDTNLTPATDKIIEVAVRNYNTAGNDGVVVVSDELVSNLDIWSLSVIGNVIDINNEEEIETQIYEEMSGNVMFAFQYSSKSEMESSSVGLKVMITFVGLYLGITFAISSATVLAIGQLSESSDNKSRYKILKDLGADKKMINKALFIQILIVFTFPLLVALVHSYVGLSEVNSLIISVGNIDLTSSIIFTALFMVIMYGGYFLITYYCSKNIIKD